MSSVRLAQQPYLLAKVGEVNPLPDFQNVSYVHSTVTWDDTLTESDTKYMRFGRVGTILPYLTQDGYTREKKVETRPAVVLENEHVRAEFLPWMGGRLWSLKCGGRELLYKNPVVQPCNLALRNAWCSGGVEWNVGIRGHNMLTNDDLFTELLSLPDGTKGVRMYEYERIRGVVYRIEAYLPPESRFLFVQTHIENPRGNGETPMYWWSNIAVLQAEGMRVVAPAKTAILSLYDAGQYRMLRRPLPVYEGMDLSRPTQITRSLDAFFDIEPGARPFIAALQPDHTGLVQCSTKEMPGRKLFVWGVGEGGKNWQRFLSDGKQTYVEIQAGIAKTQQDHLPMPDGAVWTWTEAYGPIACDTDGLNYAAASAACEEALNRALGGDSPEKERDARGRAIASTRGELVYSGAGWGAVENARRAAEGLPPVSGVCRFPENSVTEKEAPWLALLTQNVFPDTAPLSPPKSYMTGTHWLDKLQNAAQTGWLARYHEGVMRHALGDLPGAEAAFQNSLKICESPWARRALARLYALKGDADGCLSSYEKAVALLPGNRSLTLEYAQAMLDFSRFEALRALLYALPETLRNQPRFLYLEASAAVALGDAARAEDILLAPLVIPDMREGELSLCELWFSLYMKKEGISRAEAEKRHPLPHALDFRMH